MIDDKYGIIIERDQKEGISNKACKENNIKNCFNKIADLKEFIRLN